MTRAAKIKGLRAKEFAPPREIKRCAFLVTIGEREFFIKRVSDNPFNLEDLYGTSKTSITWNPTDRCVLQRDHHWQTFRVEMGSNVRALLGQSTR
jgi:hypothetical protein